MAVIPGSLSPTTYISAEHRRGWPRASRGRTLVKSRLSSLEQGCLVLRLRSTFATKPPPGFSTWQGEIAPLFEPAP